MQPPFSWFALQSPWSWLAIAAWILLITARAPRAYAWWMASATVAAWMAAAIAVLPWHLFTGGPVEVAALWGTWLGCTAIVGTALRWMERRMDHTHASSTPHGATGAPPPAPAQTQPTERDS